MLSIPEETENSKDSGGVEPTFFDNALIDTSPLD